MAGPCAAEQQQSDDSLGGGMAKLRGAKTTNDKKQEEIKWKSRKCT